MLRTTLPFVLVLALALAACDAFVGTPVVGSPEPRVSAPEPAPVASPSAPPPGDADTLRTVLARGIAAPNGSDGTYDVDPFVAAYLFESLLRTRGGSDFTRVNAEGDVPEGYRVGPAIEGSVWARLGLVPGDIVVAIEDVPATATDSVLLALRGAERRLRVEVFRDDFSFTNLYRMNEGLAWRTLLGEIESGKVTAEAAANAPVEETGTNVEPRPSPSGTVVEPRPSSPTPRVEPRPSPSPIPRVEPRPSPSPTPPPRPKPSPRPSVEPRPTPVPAPDASADVRCASASACTMSKAYFDRLVAAPDRLKAEADVVPAIRDDVFSGYRIKSVKPGGAAARLGFRAGDKVTHVNGLDLTNDAEALRLYLGLPSTKVFRLRYERGTSTLTKTVTVE